MNLGVRHFYSVIAKLFTAILMLPLAVSADVVIVTSNSPHALDIAKKVQAAITLPSSIKQTLDVAATTDIVVALGNDALEQATVLSSTTVVAAYINYSDAPQSAKNVRRIIYSDPSPRLVAEFIDRNFSNTRIGFIYTDADASFSEQIAKSLKGKRNELIPIRFNGNVFDGITDLTKQKIDIMLIGRNREIYKPDNIRFILEALFRKKVPVITTSKSLIKAGALVSIAPKDEQITEAVGRAVSVIVKDKEAVRDEFINDLEIQTNRSMTDFYNWHEKQVGE